MSSPRLLTSLCMLLALSVSAGCAAKTKQLQTELGACNQANSTCQADLQAAQKALAKAKESSALAEKRLAAYRDIATKLRAAFDGGDINLEIRDGRLIVKLPNSILFDVGKSELKPEGMAVLAKVAGVLKSVPDRRFVVAGHTDNQPVNKTATAFKTNWELSTQRALSALYFLETKGVAPKQLAAAGYGQYQPLAANSNDANRAKNRRTEIVIMPLIDEIPKLPSEI